MEESFVTFSERVSQKSIY